MNYGRTAKEIAAELGSDIDKGLPIDKAHGRIHSRGRNVVRIPKKVSTFAGMGKRAFSLMNVLLALMAVINIFMYGADGWYLSVLFIVCAVMNAAVGVIGFRRDSSPARAVSAALNGNVQVLRSGLTKSVPAMLLAQGDVIFLEAGQTVPADAKIIESDGAVVDETILSGDGGSVAKSADADTEELTVIYMGSRLLNGKIKAIVTAVGDNTQLGSTMGIMSAGEERVPSLAKKIEAVGNIFGAIAAVVWLAALVLRLAGGYGLSSAFVNSISAAVAALPITLPPLVLLTIGIDIIRLRNRGVDLRSASTVENVGASTMLCVGKRGTLTEQGFGVGEIRPGTGFDANRLRMLAALCTTVKLEDGVPVGDPMQAALVSDAIVNGTSFEELKASAPLESVFDRHRERRLMTTVHRTERGYIVICKGAPDAVAACCDRIYDGGIRPFDAAGDLAAVIGESNRMADRALSVMAVAYRETSYSPDLGGEIPEKGMIFAGLIGLSNAVRPDTPSAVKQLRSMGVRTCLITNENLTTATAVARQSGIPDDVTVQGNGLDCGNVAALRRTTVFADISARQKADIVAALNAEKENVITVGRGARDINAMNNGDVSVATDAGAKVCAAAADMKISGSGMGRIAEAVRECKRIFFNIERMMGFLLSCSIAQAICALISIGAGYSAPFSPVGIIWLDLAVSVAAAVGIWREPYHRNPVNKSELNTMKSGRISGSVIRGSVIRGALVGLAAMAVYIGFAGKIDIYQLRGAVILILCLGFAFMAQSCRSAGPVAPRFLKNPTALVCLGLNLAVCALTVGVGQIRETLGIRVPSAPILAVCAAAALIPALLAEGAKLLTAGTKKSGKKSRRPLRKG